MSIDPFYRKAYIVNDVYLQLRAIYLVREKVDCFTNCIHQLTNPNFFTINVTC